MTTLNLDQNLGIGHNYTFTIADESVMARILEWFMRGRPFQWYIDAVRHPSEKMRSLICQAVAVAPKHLLEQTTQKQYHNLVPSVLRNSLATLISGTTVTPTFKANYLALGTGAASPANSDTQLQTETIRSLFGQRQVTNNVAYLDVFFGTAQVAGNTYLEAGIFVDGAAGANTGYLLSHVAINLTLGSSQTLTVNSTITVS